MVVLFLVFWGTSILIFIVTVVIYILTNTEYKGSFFFSYPCQHLLLFIFLAIPILGWDGIFNIVLICISPIAKDVASPFVFLLRTFFFSSFAHLLIKLFFGCLIFLVLFIFWIVILSQMNRWQRFSPIP
jgi:hypothetical protein